LRKRSLSFYFLDTKNKKREEKTEKLVCLLLLLFN